MGVGFAGEGREGGGGRGVVEGADVPDVTPLPLE